MTIPMQWALRRRMMMAALGSGIDVAALSITYTGAYTDYGMVTMSDGARYRLLAFTASGTLSIEQPVNCEVCVVGGGANGESTYYYSRNSGCGGAGAYLKNQNIAKYGGGPVVVGAGESMSSIGDVSVSAVSGKNGGSGGGAGSKLEPGTGDGISKYPFGDSSYSLWLSKPHCGGGGGGAEDHQNYYNGHDYTGGNGGSNGSNGTRYVESGYNGGLGGAYGGGRGWRALSDSLQSGSKNATYYGSGGGGGPYGTAKDDTDIFNAGASGYQGIVYMRIPEEQAA